jgi:hypothetical protein
VPVVRAGQGQGVDGGGRGGHAAYCPQSTWRPAIRSQRAIRPGILEAKGPRVWTRSMDAV